MPTPLSIKTALPEERVLGTNPPRGSRTNSLSFAAAVVPKTALRTRINLPCIKLRELHTYNCRQ